jgi:hypothetical protein
MHLDLGGLREVFEDPLCQARDLIWGDSLAVIEEIAKDLGGWIERELVEALLLSSLCPPRGVRGFIRDRWDDAPRSEVRVVGREEVLDGLRHKIIAAGDTHLTKDLEGRCGTQRGAASGSKVRLQGMAEAAIRILEGTELAHDMVRTPALEVKPEAGHFKGASLRLDELLGSLEGIS